MIRAGLKAAVLGSPISHSLSPFIHNAAYSLLDIEGMYSAIEVKSGELAAFLKSAEVEDFRGFSVTMPLKEEAALLASNLDPHAALTSSVNTLIRSESGWQGFNTDVTGIRTLINELGFLGDRKGTVAILGAGGTARAALAAVSDFATRQVFRRSLARDEALRKIDSEVQIVDWSAVNSSLECDLLISTVPAEASGFSLADWHMGSVIDAIYSPWPPPITKYCLQKKIPLASGLDLLLAQAMDQIRLMTEVDFNATDLRKEIGLNLSKAHGIPQGK